jgi:tetratricopeptide (TPR) repeat protein
MQRKIIAVLLIICMLFTACSKQETVQEVPTQAPPTQEELTYQQALVLFDQGNFAEAASLFTDLGAYKKSPYMLSEIQMTQKYDEAMALVAAEQYPEAFRALSELGDYKDIPQQLERFRAVEITKDNWQEYFEFVTDVKLITNNKGEYAQARFDYRIQMKDDVYNRVYDFARNDVLITVGYHMLLRDFHLDPQTGYYAMEVLTDCFTSIFSYSKPILFVGDQKKLDIVDDTSTHSMDGGMPCNSCWEYTNFTVKDIEGYLFLYE